MHHSPLPHDFATHHVIILHYTTPVPPLSPCPQASAGSPPNVWAQLLLCCERCAQATQEQTEEEEEEEEEQEASPPPSPALLH